MSPGKWYTTTELVGLPRLPSTRRGIQLAGERGKLVRRKREHGSGWEYAFSSLPAATQSYLEAREREDSSAQQPPIYLGISDDCSAKRSAEAARRRVILRPILDGKIKGCDAIATYVGYHGIDRSTVYRWLQKYRKYGALGLLDQPRSDRGKKRGPRVTQVKRIAKLGGSAPRKHPNKSAP